MDLIYKNEKILFTVMLTISLLVWSLLILGTFGMALIYVLLFFVFYCFAQSALISHIKGTGVRITDEQFPDLKARISACCGKLDVDEEPEAYLMHMGGMFNAFATRFLGRNFIVLYSDIVDALDDDPDALNFYIGHELGHLKRNHLRWSPVLMPASVLPLIGSAYSRAREYTCDRHGLAACEQAASAQVGLAALAAGGKRWRTINHAHYVAQSTESEGFWMSLHELVADYPWLVKRMGAVRSLAAGAEIKQPSRHPMAVLLALFVPRFGVGGGGAIVTVAIIGILAAVAIPAYQEYISKANVAAAVIQGRQATVAVEKYYRANKALPATVGEAGFQVLAGGAVDNITIDQNQGVVQVAARIGSAASAKITFTPSSGEDGRIVWECSGGDIRPALLPADCR